MSTVDYYSDSTSQAYLCPVTDMLLAMLNCCTKEELEESSDEEALVSPTPSEDPAERRKVIKNNILAVGRMARVFALLRYAVYRLYQFLH